MMGEAGVIAALVLAGLVLVLLEVLTPTFGVLAGMATAAFIGAIVYGYFVSTTLGTVLLVSLLVAVPVYCVILVKRLPSSPIGHWVFLRKAEHDEGSGQPERQEYQQLVGKTGQSLTPLRPSGAVRIDGKRYYAMAEGPHLSADQRVKVLRYDGMDIIVRADEQES